MIKKQEISTHVFKYCQPSITRTCHAIRKGYLTHCYKFNKAYNQMAILAILCVDDIVRDSVSHAILTNSLQHVQEEESAFFSPSFSFAAANLANRSCSTFLPYSVKTPSLERIRMGPPWF